MAVTIKSLRRSFTLQQVQYIITLRFGNPPNYAQPLRSFGSIKKLTGLQPTTTWKMCKRYLLRGQIVLGRASTAVSELLNEHERGFLLDLQELRNFGLIKRAALFNAKFGRKISVWKIQKFYKENKVHYGRPSRLFNRAISNRNSLDILRS